MFTTLVFLSGSPCGNKANCETLALTNNIAEPLGHAATQAPQPMQAAASKASSETYLSTRIAFASTAFPVLVEIKPPASIILSKALLSTIRSFITGNDADLHGSTTIVSPSL